MTAGEVRNLEIFNAIESKSGLTQRRLASALDISLGSANALIQEMARNNWVDVSRSGSSFRYSLTPEGIQEKLRLLELRFDGTLARYVEIRDQITTALENPAGRKIVFYGAGALAEIAFAAVCNGGFKFIGIVDDRKAGMHFFGRTVAETTALSNGSLNGQAFDILLITTRFSRPGVPKHLARIVTSARIVVPRLSA